MKNILFGLIFCLTLSGCMTKNLNKNSYLTEKEIEHYTNVLPIVNESDELIDAINLTKDDFKTMIENFIRIKPIQRQNDIVFNDIMNLDNGEKMEINNTFVSYKAEVKDMIFQNGNPKLKKGDMITVLIKETSLNHIISFESEHDIVIPIENTILADGDYIISYPCGYYVVEDDYLITAYQNDYGYNGCQISLLFRD